MLGLTYFLSVINIIFRDIQNIWGIFVHSLLFISPIFWRVDKVDGFPLQIQKINPLGQLIEITHKLVISGQVPEFHEWAYTTISILGIFFFGFFVFHKFEDKITEEL